MAKKAVLLEIGSNNLIAFGNRKEFTIGRSAASSLDIPSTYISRNQCLIKKHENEWRLTDLSTFRNTSINDESVKGTYHRLKDGDKISFTNYKDQEFLFYSDAHNLQNIAKKRKLDNDDIIEDSFQVQITQGVKEKKEKLLDKCHLLELENQKLNDKIKHLSTLSENSQKSLTLLETENKRMQDTLKEEVQAKELLMIKISQLEESVKNLEIENHKHLDNYLAIPQTSSHHNEKIMDEFDSFDEMNLNDVLVEADYFHNFDYSSPSIGSPINPEPSVQILENSNSSELLSDDLKKHVEHVEIAFTEAENVALIREMEKKDQLVTSAIREKETFRTNILEAFEHELLCGVCSEILYQSVTLNCKHTFCKLCLSEWKKKKKECPVCRTKIKVEISTIILDSFIDKTAEVLGDEFKTRRAEVKEERKTNKKSPKSTARKKGGRRTRNQPSITNIFQQRNARPINAINLSGAVFHDLVSRVTGFVDLTD